MSFKTGIYIDRSTDTHKLSKGKHTNSHRNTNKGTHRYTHTYTQSHKTNWYKNTYNHKNKRTYIYVCIYIYKHAQT